MKSFYYQFVNLVQSIPPIWFYTIFLCGISCVLMLMIKFFKKFDDSEMRFEKLSLLIIAVMLIGVIVYLTYLWW